MKTSQAKIYTARLNPIHDNEAQVIKAIEDWSAQGVNFKQLIVDRILRVDVGIQPTTQNANVSIENLLSRYTEHLLAELERRGIQTGGLQQSDSEPSDGEVSPFMRKFAKGFLERQGRVDE